MQETHLSGDPAIHCDIQSLSIHFCYSSALNHKLQLSQIQSTSIHSKINRMDGHCFNPVAPNCRLLEQSSLLALTLIQENILCLEATMKHQIIVQKSLPEYFCFIYILICWCLDDLWNIQVDAQVGPSSELASDTFASSSSAETTQSATISTSSRSNTAQILSELAQSTNQIAFVSTTSVGSETASQVALVRSLPGNSQIKTLTSPKSSAPKAENSPSFVTFIQTNQYSVIALGCSLLVLTCCVCYLYIRRRQSRRSTTSQFRNSTMKPPSTKSYTSKQTASGLYSTSSSTSNQSSEYSQDQTMSVTLASTELGILVTFFILLSFALINLFENRPLCSCVSAC
jgi:hypothetical protein